MTAYRSITPLQEPQDLGLDDPGRAQYVFNVLAWKAPSETFLQELIGILVDAGVGIENQSIFASSRAFIPDPSEPGAPPALLVITATGGTGPVGIHNERPSKWDRRPSAKIQVHAKTTQAAAAMAHAAYNALVDVRNQEIVA